MVGCGFIDPSWEPRVRYAGTYDDQWVQTRNPLLPNDFDARFYNAAHPDLVAVPHLSGGEPCQLVNLNQTGTLRFSLPKRRIGVTVSMGDRRNTYPSKLDTVVVKPDDRRLMITWRATFDSSLDLTTIDWVEFFEET